MSVRDRIKMMEQIAKQEKEAAADERGRSPGGASMRSSASNESPRPLSKVRTSFVAIEKDGRIGLQRQASGDSILSGRKPSGDTEPTSSILQDSSRTYVASPDTNRGPGGPGVSPPSLQDAGPRRLPGLGRELPFAQTTQPAQPTGPVPEAPGEELSSAQPAQPAESTGPVSGSSREEVSSAKSTKLAAPASGGNPTPAGLAASPQIKPGSRGFKEGGAPASTATTATDTVTFTNGTRSENQGAKESQGPAVRDQGKAQNEGGKDPIGVQSSKGPGSSGSTSGNSGPSDGPGVTTALNGADKPKTSKPAATSLKSYASSSQLKSTGRPTHPTHPTSKPSTTPPPAVKPAADKKTPSSASPAFVKPRPKSPTRPVDLPARLTQPTAAAAAKNRNAPPPVRPASRTTMSTIGRSSSVTSRQRPSIGPPPKQTAKDHPVPKKEVRAPDESFLARMMRPTQASASKVAEKVHIPTTPPRMTATSTASRKPSSAQSGPARRVVSRTVSTTTSANATPERKDEPSLAQAVAKKVEQIPIAEEVIKVAKRAGGNVPLKISEEKVEDPKTETNAATAKPNGKENLPMVSEEVDTPKLPEKEDLSCEEKENVPETLEKSQPAPKSTEKASFGASAEKAEAPQANGNVEKGAPAADSKPETNGQPANGEDAIGPQHELVEDENETW